MKRALKGLLVCAAILAVDVLCPPLPGLRYPMQALEDTEESLTFDAVKAKPESAWKPVGERDLSLAAGEGREVWVRAQIPPAPPKERLVADIETPHLRQADFYLTEEGRTLSTGFVGMDRPFSNRPYWTPYQSFNFEPSAGHSRTLYIRSFSEVRLSLPIRFLSEQAFHVQTTLRLILCCFIFGVFAGIVLYNVFLCLSLRDRYYIYYCTAQVAILIPSLFLTGVVQMVSPYTATHYGASIRVIATTMLFIYVMIALFIQRYAGLKQTDKFFNSLILPYVIAMLLCVIPTLTMPLYVVMNGVVAIGILSGCAVLVGNLLNGRTDNAEAMFLPFAGLFAFEGIAVLSTTGVLPATAFSEYTTILGGVWEALFFSIAISNRIRSLESERANIIQALKGTAPASALNGLLSQSFRKTYRPNETNVSIMFIDVVGFSQMAERLGSQQMFRHLAQLMQDVTVIVNDCRGTVDRSLGDGVLCFFGYDEGMKMRHHAQDAFEAAQRIQEHIVSTAKMRSRTGDFVLPVRIGIHVANVLIGDLGGIQRIDFTMIGSGVNFASRLETACSPFKIMLSQETYKHLQHSEEADSGFSEIWIALKHQDELVKAFEYNPFTDTPAQLEFAEKLHLDQINVKPKEGRYAAPDRAAHLVAPQGTFRLVDFSANGFRVTCDTYVGRRATLLVELVTCDVKVNEKLRQMFLHAFFVEVRWSRGVGGTYEHGLRIFGLNAEQRRQIFQQLESLRDTDVAEHPEDIAA